MNQAQKIAIVGMGGLFPGARTLEQFWANIEHGRSAVRDAPAGQWFLPVDAVYAEGGPTPDHVYSRRGCYLDRFEPYLDGLDIDPDLVRRLDPLFGLALHVGAQAWRNAKMDRVDRKRVGVVLGNIALPTEGSSALARHYLGPKVIEQLQTAGLVGADFRWSQIPEKVDWRERYVTGLPAGILARALGLGLGSFTLDAACASSLYAMKLAMEELRAGRADAMLTGGLCRPDSLYTQMGFCQLKALSPDGRCAPFDRRANGLVVGEGAGVLVLKRLEDALRAGDTIHAVIAGLGLSNDLGGNLLAPREEGQLRAMRSAYRQAGWAPTDVDLIECHATGAPVGDAVEFGSLRQLWKDYPQPTHKTPIGSVKSNIGHLLTAAGSAGVIKVLLAMRRRQLPPSANFTGPAESLTMEQSPFTVLQQSAPWESQRNDHALHVAVSAFGFGGINAHLLLESPPTERLRATAPTTERTDSLAMRSSEEEKNEIAIVGLGIHVGPWRGLAAVEEELFADRSETSPRSFAIDHLQVPVGKFRIPPKEIEETLPQQLLMLEAAHEAFTDAKLLGKKLENAGVFIGIALDLHTTNFHFRWAQATLAEETKPGLDLAGLRAMAGPPLNANRTMGALGGIVASRVAREFQIGGPSFTISSEETSVHRALEVACGFLRRGELDVALVGGVDFPNDGRNLALEKRRKNGEGEVSIDRGFTPSDAAGAFILKRLNDARRDGDKVYAIVRGSANASAGDTNDVGPTMDACERSIHSALAETGVGPQAITFVEYGSQDATRNSQRRDLLRGVFQGSVDETQTRPTVTSFAGRLGHAGAASGVVSLLGATLALRRRLLPATTPPWDYRSLREALTPTLTPQYWINPIADSPRRALLMGESCDGNASALILEELPTSGALAPTHRLANTPVGLFCLAAKTAEDQRRRLRELRSFANNDSVSISRLALAWKQRHESPVIGDRVHSILAESVADLRGKLDSLEALTDASQIEASPTAGVFVAVKPLTNESNITFVFPGSGSHFAGMGRDLGRLFPEVLARQEQRAKRLRDQILPDLFWNSVSLRSLQKRPRDLILGHVAVGSLVTDVLRELGVHPTAALGYSLGESTALVALGAWADRDELLRRMMESSLFTEDLGGDCRAARLAWSLAPEQSVDWVVGVVDRPAETAREFLANEPMAYLLIVNAPDECVLGGDRRSVGRVVERMGCRFVPTPGISTVHCSVARSVERAYRTLHELPTTPPVGVRFYSAAAGEAYIPTMANAADAITRLAVEPFDFPRVVRQAFADGSRLFLEVGPGSATTRMIDKILGDLPRLAFSVLVPHEPFAVSLMRGVAQLLAAGVPVDVDRLFGEPEPAGRETLDTVNERYVSVSTAVPLGDPPASLARQAVRAVDEAAAEAADVEAIAESETIAAMPPSEDDASTAVGETPIAGEQASALALEPTAKGATETTPSLSMTNVNGLVDAMVRTRVAVGEAHATFLKTQQRLGRSHGRLALQLGWLARDTDAPVFGDFMDDRKEGDDRPTALDSTPMLVALDKAGGAVFLDRDQCLEFAIGKIQNVLGDRFAEIDTFPTRVRLPDEPLMLVDRIVSVAGEPGSMTSGQVVTEHDIHPGAWYLDCERIPTCIAVEAGQADLFLSGYLGIDFQTKGVSVYRLLDAIVTFHQGLPGPGTVIHYDIHIDGFFRQGDTWLFRFRFEGTVDGAPLLTMRNGCAGFFSEAELASGKGIVHTALDRRPMQGKRPADWRPLAPFVAGGYTEKQIDALRAGRLVECFGPAFNQLAVDDPVTLPAGRMRLVHRVTRLEPDGGRFGVGFIRGEADIDPNDWFLTCHFVDDQVMPGTLMYECCLHTLRVFLLRMGWVGAKGEVAYEPIPGVASQLKCRGQVISSTKVAAYEITLKEIGYGPEPFVIADALMFADDKPIVEITNMSVRLTGLNLEKLTAQWQSGLSVTDRKPAIFDYDRILAFAVGKPSVAFGDRYRVFDSERVIARLPGPPYQFLDRITRVDAEPWIMQAGGEIEAQYDVPADAWYFSEHRQPTMPFGVLLEVALQPCGWLAAFVGSALTSETDLSFRNLGGEATQFADVTPDTGTLTTTVKLTKASASGGMIIQHFSMDVQSPAGPIYQGTTYFGFFSKQALANQVGIRDAKRYAPSEEESRRGCVSPYPTSPPFPGPQLRMIDTIDLFLPAGGPNRLGYVRGTKKVDPNEWFFKAHFFQDPVCPGSLGLESFVELLKYLAAQRWGIEPESAFRVNLGGLHQWVYRGQVIPVDDTVTVDAVVTKCDDVRKTLTGEGFLEVDGRVIYHMVNFEIGLTSRTQ